MTKLEIRKYTRDEIAAIIQISKNDTNFKRKITTTLTNWGYTYNYKPKEVEIIATPQTPFERAKEMLIRLFNFDIQIDFYALIVFLFLLSIGDDNFDSMPWAQRAEYMEKNYNICVSDRTLRQWYSVLISSNSAVKDDNTFSYWYSVKENGSIRREILDIDGNANDKDLLENYNKTKRTLIRKGYKWKEIHEMMWDKYHFQIYKCKKISLCAWNNNASYAEIEELLNIIEEIVDNGAVEIIERHSIELIAVPVEKVIVEDFVF